MDVWAGWGVCGRGGGVGAFTLSFPPPPRGAGPAFLWAPVRAGPPAPGVTRRRALWSADFPRHGRTVTRSPGQLGHAAEYNTIPGRCSVVPLPLGMHRRPDWPRDF